MNKKFTKRQLMDQCGFTAEETQLILDYQKKLPILSTNDKLTSFCVNARDLHTQLKAKVQFSKWIKSNIESGDFVRETDYMTCLTKNNESVSFKDYAKFSPQKLSSLGILTEYFLTLECAKEIAMYAGVTSHANKELKTNSKLARKYFILMEDAIKRINAWELIRNPLREGYKAMQKALDNYMLRLVQRNADDWDYIIEADALNIIATGFPAKDIRLFVGCKDNVTRDSLTSTYNEYLLKLQELNIIYLGMNMNRYERYNMLAQSFHILFPNAVPIRNDIDILTIEGNKNRFLEEVKQKVNGAA